MNLSEIQQLDGAYMAETFSRFPVAIERGKGATLYDTDGKRYIDFGAGIAVNIFGANDERWKKAVIGQLDKIQHVSNLYYCEPQVRLAELLCDKSGAKRVFFANSGAEANECALKAARKYSFQKYGEGRAKIVSLKNSFHGRTLFTLTATGQDAFHKYFAPFAAEVDYSAPNMAEMRKVADVHTCAVIIECVQGESGVEALDKEFVKELRSYCTEKDILLICDEVQSGNGRTGKYFAYEHYGITPDIVTTAKGLGGGLPLVRVCFSIRRSIRCKRAITGSDVRRQSRVLCRGDQYRRTAGRSVFAGSSGKERISQGEAQRTAERRKGFGIGMMIGLEIDRDAKEIAQKCLEKGLLVLTAHSKVRIVPPLNITKTEIDEGLMILREVLSL